MDSSPELLGQLAKQGIHVAARGLPGLPGSTAVPEALRSPCSAWHLLSAYLETVAQSRFSTLFTNGSSRDSVRLLSCSGPTAGASLIAPMHMEGVFYTEAEWRTALQWRLETAGPAGTCRNEIISSRREDGSFERCNAVLDPDGDHALCCMCGPVRTTTHNHIADKLCDFLHGGGAQARREVHVREFRQRGRAEPYLDVWGWGTPDVTDLLVDVTWRHPMAQRYLPTSAAVAGHSCALACADKSARYVSQQGRQVHTFAVESWGRLGDAAELLLADLACSASRFDSRRGRDARGRLARWRCCIDGALQHGVVHALHSACFGLPGRRA